MFIDTSNADFIGNELHIKTIIEALEKNTTKGNITLVYLKMLFKPSDKNPYAPLAIKEFRYFVCGRALFMMGIRMTVTLIGWWMYELTNSKLALGLVGLSEVIPALSLALYAGHYIDLHEKESCSYAAYCFTLSALFVLLCFPQTMYQKLRAMGNSSGHLQHYCHNRRYKGV